MSFLGWIWAYLFDCVHFHTTWPQKNPFGHAYVCCLDCGREMLYSLEHMQIVGRNPISLPRQLQVLNVEQGEHHA